MVVDAETKRVKRDFGRRKNLILDAGLNEIASRGIPDCMKYAAAGTSSTSAAVDQTLLISQVSGLAGWSSTNVAGENGTVRSGSDVTHTRMWDFASPSVLTTYREAGVSWSSTQSATPLFSRVILNGTTGVDVSTSEQLRLVYELTITYSPTVASNAKSALVTHPGGDADGDWAVCALTDGGTPYETINSDGNTVTSAVNSNALEPGNSVEGGFWMSDTDKTLPVGGMWFQAYADSPNNWAKNADNSPANITLLTGRVTASAYVNGSFTKTRTVVVNPADGAITFKVFGIGNTTTANANAYEEYCHLVCVLDAPVTKSNTQKFTFTYTFTWNRV
jgi:hypothetical protein